MLRTLLPVRKVSLVTVPTTTSTSSTSTSPRLRLGGTGRRRRQAAAAAVAPPATAAGPGRRARRPRCRRWLTGAASLADPARSCRTPFHDEVEHRVLVEVAGGRLVDDAPLAHDEHAVGQSPSTSGTSLETSDDAHPGVGQPADEAVELDRGRRRRRRGWARRAAAPCRAEQPAREHHLLLVAAGQGADGARSPSAGGRRAPARPLARGPASSARGRTNPRGRTGTASPARCCGPRSGRAAGACALRSSGARPRPARDGGAGTEPAAAAGRRRAPARRSAPPGAVDGLEDLRAAGADQPGDADDLAGAARSGRTSAKRTGQREPLDAQRRARSVGRCAGPCAAGRRTRRCAPS